MQRRPLWLIILVAVLAIVVSRYNGSLAPATTGGVAQQQAPAGNAANDNSATPAPGSGEPVAGDVDAAFHDHSTNVELTASGTVARVLADDTQGLKHQRFVLRMPSGLTVLVAHDIDEAPRVPDLRAGQPLLAHGEYVWNAQGGIVHWTHHDSSGRHAPGWIDYDGRRYQ
jgi:hypothetical protein